MPHLFLFDFWVVTTFSLFQGIFVLYYDCNINWALENLNRNTEEFLAQINCLGGHGFMTYQSLSPVSLCRSVLSKIPMFQSTHDYRRLNVQNRCCHTYRLWHRCRGGRNHHRIAEGGRSFLHWSFLPGQSWRGGQDVREHFHPKEARGRFWGSSSQY